jgi:hypothetical protein
VTHYHLNFSNQDRNVISQIRYEYPDEAAIAFLDMCYYIYPDLLDDDGRSEYFWKLYGILNAEEGQVVMIPSQKLTIGVMRCPYERCSAATDN